MELGVFVLDLAHGPLRPVSGAAPGGTINKTRRTRHGATAGFRAGLAQLIPGVGATPP